MLSFFSHRRHHATPPTTNADSSSARTVDKRHESVVEKLGNPAHRSSGFIKRKARKRTMRRHSADSAMAHDAAQVVQLIEVWQQNDIRSIPQDNQPASTQPERHQHASLNPPPTSCNKTLVPPPHLSASITTPLGSPAISDDTVTPPPPFESAATMPPAPRSRRGTTRWASSWHRAIRSPARKRRGSVGHLRRPEVTSTSLLAGQGRFQDELALDGTVLGSGINGRVLGCVATKKGASVKRRFVVKAVAEDHCVPEVELQKTGAASPYVVPIAGVYTLPTAEWTALSGEEAPPGASNSVGVRLIVTPRYTSDLFDRWDAKGGKLPESVVQGIARQLGRAVSHLHACGITHRDIKPENLLLSSTKRWDIALADFGLATGQSPPSGWNSCTLQYAPPEQVERYITHSMEPYTSRVDEWSIGVTLFLLMVGRWPFHHSNNADDADVTRDFLAELKASPTSLNTKNATWANISEAGRDAITRLLQPDPEARMTVDELLAHPWLSNECGRRAM
jgi:hypothetical protein